MKQAILKIHPKDNVLIALTDLAKGEEVQHNGDRYKLSEDIPAKHKFTTVSLKKGEAVLMYGVLVGKAKENIPAGARISVSNLVHAADDYQLSHQRKTEWHIPDVTAWKQKNFMGYHRADGSVGTANYWLVVPLVFCENRNVEVLKEALLEGLGYARPKKYNHFVRQLLASYKKGISPESIKFEPIDPPPEEVGVFS